MSEGRVTVWLKQGHRGSNINLKRKKKTVQLLFLSSSFFAAWGNFGVQIQTAGGSGGGCVCINHLKKTPVCTRKER